MKGGVLYEDFKNGFGKDNPDLLVWKASSLLMNPSLKAEYEAHPHDLAGIGACLEQRNKLGLAARGRFENARMEQDNFLQTRRNRIIRVERGFGCFVGRAHKNDFCRQLADLWMRIVFVPRDLIFGPLHTENVEQGLHAGWRLRRRRALLERAARRDLWR